MQVIDRVRPILFVLLFVCLGGSAGGLAAQETATPAAGQPDFNPYLVAIPGSGLNESALIVSAGGLSEQARPVYVNADQGPTSHKHSYAMTFDSDEKLYRYTLDNFFASPAAVAGTVEITTTGELSQTVSGGERHYERWPLLYDEAARLSTQNGFFTLSLDKASFDADLTYLLVIETAAPVADPPGRRGLSVAYTLWASGAVNQSQRPYLLILTYLENGWAAQTPRLWASSGMMRRQSNG
ncbi:MAG: hypothetical protein HY328_16655 [Chloroflexi bacterium]|nr:hypothetical protein [Chloroflexota bacterium]